MSTIHESIYGITLFLAMFFGFWEMSVKRDLTSEMFSNTRSQGFKSPPGSIRETMKREELLRKLPEAARAKQRMLGIIKIGFFIALIVEVLITQLSS